MPFFAKRRQVIKGLFAGLTASSLWVFASEKKLDQGMNDFTLSDPETKRTIGVRVRLPAIKKQTGLILYSPGLGSGFSNGASWCDAWQKAGFVVVTLSHPVTNDEIWNTQTKSLKVNLHEAIASPQYGLRVKDCRFVLSYCLKHSELKEYIDPNLIGIAGHSYGALTTQSIAGQQANKRDERIKAAIAFSPGAISLDSAKTMSGVKIPFFCVTGDHDNYVTFKNGIDEVKLGNPLKNRKAVYENLPTGAKQMLVLANADHMTFAGEFIDDKNFSRDIAVTKDANEQAWKRINEMTTAFWEYYLAPVKQKNREVLIEKTKASANKADEVYFG